MNAVLKRRVLPTRAFKNNLSNFTNAFEINEMSAKRSRCSVTPFPPLWMISDVCALLGDAHPFLRSSINTSHERPEETSGMAGFSDGGRRGISSNTSKAVHVGVADPAGLPARPGGSSHRRDNREDSFVLNLWEL